MPQGYEAGEMFCNGGLLRHLKLFNVEDRLVERLDPFEVEKNVNAATNRTINYYNRCLQRYGMELNSKGIDYMNSLVGEIIGNADELVLYAEAEGVLCRLMADVEPRQLGEIQRLADLLQDAAQARRCQRVHLHILAQGDPAHHRRVQIADQIKRPGNNAAVAAVPELFLLGMHIIPRCEALEYLSLHHRSSPLL